MYNDIGWYENEPRWKKVWLSWARARFETGQRGKGLDASIRAHCWWSTPVAPAMWQTRGTPGSLKPHGRMCRRAAPPCRKSCDKRERGWRNVIARRTVCWPSFAGEVFDRINLFTWCENGFILSPTQGREHRQMKYTTDARHRLPGRMRCSQTNSRQTDWKKQEDAVVWEKYPNIHRQNKRRIDNGWL